MREIPDHIYEEVKGIYITEIHLPVVKPQKQFVLCPIGLVGAGKTTVIRPLAERLDLIRISGDEIRKIFKEKGFGYDRVKELAFNLVVHFLEIGYSVAVDSDCVSEESQKYITEAEERFGVKIVWIHINPPEEFILHKLKNLKQNWLGTGDEMIENYYQRKPLHQRLTFPFVYTFDTSKDNLSTQIDEAVQKIGTILLK